MQEQGRMNQQDQSLQNQGSAGVANEAAAYPAEERAPIEEGAGAEGRDLQNVNEHRAAMFGPEETDDLRSRWQRIQTDFIDDPRRSAEQADELVVQTMNRLGQIFAQEREKLEREWDRGDDVSTEDLRTALQRYRSFFDRLLSI